MSSFNRTVKAILSPDRRGKTLLDLLEVEDLQELSLGRLHLLKEPAGKVRTIAIVDYWTQRSLRALHDWMGDVLRLLPMDCTYDQEGGLESLTTFMKARGISRS